jgi:hypothetical protein
MPNTMPDRLSGIMRDHTLTPGDRLQLMEALFVHDSAEQGRDEQVDTTRAARSSRLAPQVGSGSGRPRGSARASRH